MAAPPDPTSLPATRIRTRTTRTRTRTPGRGQQDNRTSGQRRVENDQDDKGQGDDGQEDRRPAPPTPDMLLQYNALVIRQLQRAWQAMPLGEARVAAAQDYVEALSAWLQQD